jgi:hypothetical protein
VLQGVGGGGRQCYQGCSSKMQGEDGDATRGGVASARSCYTMLYSILVTILHEDRRHDSLFTSVFVNSYCSKLRPRLDFSLSRMLYSDTTVAAVARGGVDVTPLLQKSPPLLQRSSCRCCKEWATLVPVVDSLGLLM